MSRHSYDGVLLLSYHRVKGPEGFPVWAESPQADKVSQIGVSVLTRSSDGFRRQQVQSASFKCCHTLWGQGMHTLRVQLDS